MANSYINEVNDSLKDASRMRCELHFHNFYNEEILKEICSNIQTSPGIGSYLSSYIVYEGTPTLRLNLRKPFFKRFGDNKNNSFEFYSHLNSAIKQCYINHIQEISMYIKDYPYLLSRIEMMYTISRIDDNIIFINL